MNPLPARLLTIGAVIELAVGIGLVLAPLFVLNLILGTGTDAVGTLVARLAGLALVSLGVMSWASRTATGPRPGLVGMLAYNGLAAAFFLYVGLTGLGTVLLWLVVVLHAVLAGLFAVALRAR